MGKESKVEIPEGSGNFYRYEYEDGQTLYRGPVGDAPSISEEEFMAMSTEAKEAREGGELYKAARWYNPFRVEVNDKAYQLKDIIIYDKKTGEEFRVGRGWFDTRSEDIDFWSGNNELQKLDIPPVSLRRKVKKDGETFIISKGKEMETWQKAEPTHAELYMPFDTFDFEVTDKQRTTGFRTTITKLYTDEKRRIRFEDFSQSRVEINKDKQRRAKTLWKRQQKIEKELEDLDPYKEARPESK